MSKKFKKLLCSFLALSVLSSAAAISVYAENDETTTIRIVHTNDMHGYYTATSRGQIGFSALKKIIEQEDADLVLDSGDTFHGQSFATVEQGKSIAELMDEVGYDAMTIGNHDLSYGTEHLKKLDEETNFKILAANVVTDGGDEYFDNSYLVKEVTADDGTKLNVGVIGVVDDRFYSSTKSDNVKGLTFREEAVAASGLAKSLREDENCDIVIAITHQADCEGFVGNISGIDAVIAGHEHILMDNDYTDKDGKAVRIVEAGCYFQNIGVLSLTYDKDSKTVTASEKTYSSADTQDLSDEKTSDKIAEIETREQSILNEVIGTSSKEYPYSWEEIRISEQPIGRIVTAAYLDCTGADVAIENAGGIRGGIPSGDITYSNLISISPYGNVIVEKELSGQQIVDMLETSLEINRNCGETYEKQKELAAKGEDPYQIDFPANSGSALQFGGVQAEYDITKPIGERVSNVKIGGFDIDLSKTYRVISNNYTAENTIYPALANAPVTKEYTTCEQAIRNYIAKGIFEETAEKANIVPVQVVEPSEPSEPSEESEPSETSEPSEESKPTEPSEQSKPSESNSSQPTQSSQTSENKPTDTPDTSDRSFNPVIIFFLISGVTAVFIIAKKKITE